MTALQVLDLSHNKIDQLAEGKNAETENTLFQYTRSDNYKGWAIV